MTALPACRNFEHLWALAIDRGRGVRLDPALSRRSRQCAETDNSRRVRSRVLWRQQFRAIQYWNPFSAV